MARRSLSSLIRSWALRNFLDFMRAFRSCLNEYLGFFFFALSYWSRIQRLRGSRFSCRYGVLFRCPSLRRA